MEDSDAEFDDDGARRPEPNEISDDDEPRHEWQSPSNGVNNIRTTSVKVSAQRVSPTPSTSRRTTPQTSTASRANNNHTSRLRSPPNQTSWASSASRYAQVELSDDE